MHYEGTVIRPPSEADSIILQVTAGCPHNGCTFCGTYKDKLYRIKDQELIDEDLDFVARHCHRQNTMFLADGDVLSLSWRRLLRLFGKIREKAGWIRRIRLYARASSILDKSLDELRELKNLGLDRIYMDLESGSDLVLENVRKGSDSEEMIQAGRKARDAGLFLSATVLLGLGGTALSREHAVQTGTVLSRMEPNQIAVLTLMLLPNTELYLFEKEGKFVVPSQRELLSELHLLIENTRVHKNCQFQANHSSNYLPVNGRLPRDREKILTSIRKGLAGQGKLREEKARSL
ncbi:MAG: radical SAM protein [Desulfurivibrionaceae bacterium]